MGAPWQIAVLVQAGLPVMSFASMEDLVGEVEWERRSGNSLLVRQPVGVVGAITPWNYPLHQIAAKVAPALVAGCTVMDPHNMIGRQMGDATGIPTEPVPGPPPKFLA